METVVRPRPLQALAVFAAAVVAAALIGVLGVTGTSSEYQTLDRPGWAPPSAVFGPVWTALYVAIAASGWIVWRRVGWSRELLPYAVQLVLNALWTPLFFGAGARGLALADILALWIAIVWTVLTFRRVSTWATVLLLPYLAWTTYAVALNAAVWQLNR
ncbi:TspO/MBR family protein [Kribbella sp. HUAS MG21]|jgi:tryptophan-rich sensory protein|uniref:TspO/MBR family protein n=1 Tax=Kribbella sp. HUAS MG21 TaxID=3160966 RepID=A0AAU7TEA6_9ACTN